MRPCTSIRLRPGAGSWEKPSRGEAATGAIEARREDLGVKAHLNPLIKSFQVLYTDFYN